MSAVGDARQRPAASRATAWPGQVLHGVFRLALVLLGLAVLGATGLAWRLAQGPLDVTGLARWAEAAKFPGDKPHWSIGAATVAWNGFAHGADRGLQIRLRDVALVDAAGAPGARLSQASLALSLRRLLEGHVVPRRLAATGLRLRAVRAADGDVRLDLAGLDDGAKAAQEGPSLGDILAELRQPADTDRGGAHGLDALAQLQGVQIRDAQFLLVDRGTGQTFRAELADLDLERQDGGGVKGAAEGEVAAGAERARLQLAADLLPGGGTHLAATLAPMQLGALAQSVPAMVPLDAVDARLQANASLDLTPALLPRGAELHLSIGRGTLSLLGGAMTFDRLALDATGRWDQAAWLPSAVSVKRAQAVLPSPQGSWSTTVSLDGDATRRDGKLEADARLTVDHAAFADLGALWPEAWGGHVRPWLVENVTAGTVRDGAFSFKLAAPEADPAAVKVTAAGGTMQGSDLTIHWLRPVPPIEHAQAVLTVVGPDVVEMTVPVGAQGRVALKDGQVRFTGLSAKDQSMALSAAVLGPVPDVLQLLRHKRLNLLSKHPIPITSSAGALTGKLTIDMPMRKDLKFEQVKIAATGRLSALRLGGLVAGRDLDGGTMDFSVDQDGMQASGEATVAEFAGAVEVAMDFRPGPPTQVLQRASMKGIGSAAQIRAAGGDPNGVVTGGEAALSAAFSSQRDGAGRVELKAGLAGAALSLLGWRKPPGPAASLAATLLLEHEKLAGVTDIAAHGPGLAVQGRAEMVGGAPRLLRLDKMVLGSTQAEGDVRFPDRPEQPIRVRLTGAQLDLSRELESKPGGDSGGKSSPWVADLRFERVLFAKGRAIRDVAAHAEEDGRRLRALDVQSSGPEKIRIVIAPLGAGASAGASGGRRLQVRAEDAGALFYALDVTDTIHGGTLAVDAEFDDRAADPPLAGTLDLREFSVHDAVAVGKVLQAITIYGIADAMRGNGVQFTRLALPFRYDRRQLHVGEARAYSPSLGLTAQGWIDFSRKILDIRGTIVPAYAVNSALGRLPVVGRLFSAERGGGLVSVNYSVTGNSANPNILVNPLSALTPGFLRGLFNVFR